METDFESDLIRLRIRKGMQGAKAIRRRPPNAYRAVERQRHAAEA